MTTMRRRWRRCGDWLSRELDVRNYTKCGCGKPSKWHWEDVSNPPNCHESIHAWGWVCDDCAPVEEVMRVLLP